MVRGALETTDTVPNLPLVQAEERFAREVGMLRGALEKLRSQVGATQVCLCTRV
jgi:hypothetical protein